MTPGICRAVIVASVVAVVAAAGALTGTGAANVDPEAVASRRVERERVALRILAAADREHNRTTVAQHRRADRVDVGLCLVDEHGGRVHVLSVGERPGGMVRIVASGWQADLGQRGTLETVVAANAPVRVCS